jgi:hypothetical protein
VPATDSPTLTFTDATGMGMTITRAVTRDARPRGEHVLTLAVLGSMSHPI